MSSPLDDIHIATPCPASWWDMEGDHRVRFCRTCSKNVYNLESMTRRAAEDLLRQTERRVCVRLYRRLDGTLITQDCRIGLAELMRRRSWEAIRALTFLAVAALGIVAVLRVDFGRLSLQGILDEIEGILLPRRMTGIRG